MASLFWDTHGIIFIDYLEVGQTINSDYYITFFKGLNRKKMAPHLKKKKCVVSLRQCTMPQTMPNSMNWAMNYFPTHRILQIRTSDYLIFDNLKRMVAGKKFRTNEEVIDETEAYFETTLLQK